MMSAALIWPLLGLCLGSLLAWCGIGLVRLVARNRHEGWLIAGTDLVLLLLLVLTVALVYLVTLIINTANIGLNHSETMGYILGVCAFDAGALAGLLASLLAALSKRRQQQGRAPLRFVMRSLLSARAWGSD